MKAKVFCVALVLGLINVASAQKPHDVTAVIIVEPDCVTLNEPVHVDLHVMNTGARNVTIREVELYCGTTDRLIWEEILTVNRLTIESGQSVSLTLPDYCPSCPGEWRMQCMMRFGGSGKRDMISTPTVFTVTG